MTGTSQPSDVRFLVQRGEDELDADLEAVHGVTSADVIAAAVASKNGTYAADNPTISSVVTNADGSWASWTENGVAHSATYNPDGTIATFTVAGVTRTYSYDGAGNVTGAA